MVRSLTLSDKSASSVLDARDRRQDALAQALSEGYSATVFVSLNIPGQEKTPPGSEALFLRALDELSKEIQGLTNLVRSCDALGFYAVFGLGLEPVEVKSRCIRIETSHPYSRLIDLDVYAVDGSQIDRKTLGFPGRHCLVCEQAAVECIRVKRHSIEEVIVKVHELLAHCGA